MGNDPARNCLVLSHSPSSWWIFEGTVAFVITPYSRCKSVIYRLYKYKPEFQFRKSKNDAKFGQLFYPRMS
jgi:hypothetical protein